MAKKHFLISIASILSSLLLWTGLVIAVDPLQIFGLTRYWKNILEAPDQITFSDGLIRYGSYTNLILGNSSFKNSTPSMVDPCWGGKSLNISVDRATTEEMLHLLQMAESQKGYQRSIIALNLYSLLQPSFIEQQTTRDNGIHFYLQNIFYFRNLKYICSTLASGAHDFDPEQYNNTIDHLEQRRHNTPGLDNSYNQYFFAALRNMPKESEIQQRWIEFHRFLASHHETKFILILPPQQELFWHIARELGKLDSLLSLRQMIIEQCQDCPNIVLYDFQADDYFLAHPELFYDCAHFKQEVNRYIFSQIKTGAKKPTLGVGESNARLQKLTKHPDPPIRNYLQRHKVGTSP